MQATAQQQGTASILPAQRRVRHLRRVVLRNLEHADVKDPVDVYFTLTCTCQPEPVYVSPIAPRTLNPSWEELDVQDISKLSAAVKSSSDFVLRVFLVPDTHPTEPVECVVPMRNLNGREKDKKLFEMSVQLASLEPLGVDDLCKVRQFPMNTPIFQMVDGYYCSKDAKTYLLNNNALSNEASQADGTKKNQQPVTMGVNEILQQSNAIVTAQQSLAGMKAVYCGAFCHHMAPGVN